MRGLLVFIGVVCLIGSAVFGFNAFTIYEASSTIMQQGVGMDNAIYSGILLLCGMFGLSKGIDQENAKPEVRVLTQLVRDYIKKGVK